MSDEPVHHPRVVIVGGGFGGLHAAKGLGRCSVDVTLIDRRNYHLFQPLLYQVATGALSPANISAPFRSLLRRQRQTRVLWAEVAGFDLRDRYVLLDDGAKVPYDWLIVAAGATHSYFGHPEWREHAPGLKSIEDATRMRQRILSAFELAERELLESKWLQRPHNVHSCNAWLTFVVIGGGPTGVELAGQVAEIARHTLRKDFRAIDARQARVCLIEAGPRILSAYPDELSSRAALALKDLGVQVLTGARVTAVDGEGVDYAIGSTSMRLPSHTVLWAAGVQASPLGARLASEARIGLDRSGRIPVQPDLTIPGHSQIYVVGDLALCMSERGMPLPAVAPVAIQQGQYVARSIAARLQGRTTEPFRYRDRGSLATIGRYQAVGTIAGWRVTGAIAWFLWLFVHLMALVQFENRLLVFVQWAWHFFTRNRSARLITSWRPEDPVVGMPRDEPSTDPRHAQQPARSAHHT